MWELRTLVRMHTLHPFCCEQRMGVLGWAWVLMQRRHLLVFLWSRVCAFASAGYGGSLAVLSYSYVNEPTKAPTLHMESISFVNSTAGCQRQRAARTPHTRAQRGLGSVTGWGNRKGNTIRVILTDFDLFFSASPSA